MSGQIIRIIALKNRALYQYGVGGGGGVVNIKKNFGNTPCKVWMVGVGSEFFNLVILKIIIFDCTVCLNSCGPDGKIKYFLI